MLCEACQQRDALVHLRHAAQDDSSEAEQSGDWEHHFCQECADGYSARTPGMNSSRDLICLSDWYQSKLYDLLETAHPEAFDTNTDEACDQGSEVMRFFFVST